MLIDIENDATVSDAMSALEAAEAAETQLPPPAFEQSENGELRQMEAVSKEIGEEKLPESNPDDTRATADKVKQPDATDKTETKSQDQNAKKQSEFARNAERLDKTWKSVNERKAALDTQEASLKQQAAALEMRANKLQIESARAKNKFTPDQYDQAATGRNTSAEQLVLQADGLDKRAEQLESNGEFGKAELAKKQAQDLRDQAAGEKYSAKQLKDMAENLRKNPDPTLKQHQETLAQHKRHYLLEAAKQWADVAKDGSPFQVKMAEHLQAAAQSGLNAEENPVLFYHVARLVAAETAAARVPTLEKDLGAAQAKVKELEKLTAPGGGTNSVQKIQQDKQVLTDADEEALLRQEALARS